MVVLVSFVKGGNVKERAVGDLILSSPFLSKLEAVSNPSRFPSKPWLIYPANLTRRVLEYAIRATIRVRSQASLKHLKDMEGKSRGRFALVVASGPSVESLNFDKISTLRSFGTLEVFAVNSSVKYPPLRSAGIDYQVISDPNHDMDFEELSKVLGLDLLEKPIKGLFAPRHFNANLLKHPLTIPFEDIEFERIGRGVSPICPRRYLSLTVLKALSLATFMGFEKIFVIGMDASMIRTLQVDKNNQLIQHANHVSGAGHEAINLSRLYPSGMADFYFDSARFHHHLKKYFGDKRIYNLDPLSLSDGLAKEDPLELTNLWQGFA